MRASQEISVNRPVQAINHVFEQVGQLRLGGLESVKDERSIGIRAAENSIFLAAVETVYNRRHKRLFKNSPSHGLHVVSEYATEGALNTEMYQTSHIKFGYKLFAQVNSRGYPMIGEQCTVFDDLNDLNYPTTSLIRTGFLPRGAERGSMQPASIAVVSPDVLGSIHERLDAVISELDTVDATRPSTEFAPDVQDRLQRLTTVPPLDRD